MKFRPCIDLHSGEVKQIVGSTLVDDKDGVNQAGETNFQTKEPASTFAKMYSSDNLTGGHVIMLGAGNESSAQSALSSYPNGLQIGGGINEDNAMGWIENGASHVIVTSWIFSGGRVDYGRLGRLVEKVGRERVVIDLSCRKKGGVGDYYVVTDRWQTFTDCKVNGDTLRELSSYCSEFLVHGVENEGKRCGILSDLVSLLGEHSPI
eukprot:CAMPEP_0118645804 /NCGR_PEP_ID=MMETSP0785-20121206/7703_1 /TAXON_ID=91992 /ORGANISM="Bolidomonas pacifica, Strain CCMP 1866" /LENGTH=206 /DNA_ID=CAMNT_0006537725 /DNA_START=296 /DNA_END=913 /DNA_ORIENTATION=-